MATRFSLISLRKHSELYLCQFAVDDIPCTPFWSTAMQKEALGEAAWMQSLRENAEMLVREHGRSQTVLS